MSPEPRSYLRPYLSAAARHGDGFASLLWASPSTQAARFDALIGAVSLEGRNLLDAGCGRADLLDHLLGRHIEPAHYVGIEAVPELADAARRKRCPFCQIIEADFVREPARLLVGADVVLFCGSLNTLDPAAFYRTITHAYEAAAEALVFNFLCSRTLAAASWLTWHRPQEVLAFAQRLCPRVTLRQDYMEGDATIALFRDRLPEERP